MIDLRHGDCLDHLRTLPDDSIDIVLTDPPYGCTQNAWDVVLDWPAVWAELDRICRRRCPILLFSDLKHAVQLIPSAPKSRPFRFDLVWEKSIPSGFLNAKKQPLRSHELLLVFYAESPVYYPQKTHGHRSRRGKVRQQTRSANYGQCLPTSYADGSRHPTSVLHVPSIYRQSSLHPTEKPVELLRWLIRSFSDRGATVLDFTMGSGSAAEAATLEDRDFIGIERERLFFDRAKARVEAIDPLLTNERMAAG